MIGWKRRCLELTEIVNRHRKDRMHSDMKLGWEMAQELIELKKAEEKAQKLFKEWWKCKDKKKAEKLYTKYLEIINDNDSITLA